MPFKPQKKSKKIRVKPAAPKPPEHVSPFNDDEMKRLHKEAVFCLIALLAAVAKTQHDRKPVLEKIRKEMVSRWMENISHLRSVAKLPLDQNEMDIVAKAVQDGHMDQNAEGVMRSIGKSLMILQKSAAKDLIYEHEDLRVLSAIGIYFRNKSESSWREIVRQIERLGIPELTTEFAPPIAGKFEFENLRERLNKQVSSLTDDPKTKAYRLTFQQQKKLQAVDHPKKQEYQDYLIIARQLRALWNNAVISICRRSTGVAAIRIEKVKETLASNGIDVDYFPEGFEGKVGINGGRISLFTSENKPINGWPLPGRMVKMNSEYDAKKDNTNVFEAFEEGKKNYYYTSDYRQKGQDKKFAVVRTALDDIDKYRKRWEAPLKAWVPGNRITLEVMLSAQAVMIYETQARIGGTSNKSTVKKAGKEVVKNTFGLSTWRMKHVKKLTATEMRVTYSGKKGVRQSHKLAGDTPLLKKLLKLLLRVSEGKEPNDFLWAYSLVKRGNYVSAADFNKFLKELGMPAGFTAHKIRHSKGTKIAREIIAAKTFKASAKATTHAKITQEATNWFKKNVAEAVAVMLGHKKTTEDGGTEALWSTSVKSYIDPSVSAKWFYDQQIRPPAWIPKSAHIEPA